MVAIFDWFVELGTGYSHLLSFYGAIVEEDGFDVEACTANFDRDFEDVRISVIGESEVAVEELTYTADADSKIGEIPYGHEEPAFNPVQCLRETS